MEESSWLSNVTVFRPAVPSCLKVFSTVNSHKFLLGAFFDVFIWLWFSLCESVFVLLSFWWKVHNDLKDSLSPNLLEVIFKNIEWQMASVSNLWFTRLNNDLVNHFACVAVRNVCFIKPFTQFKEPIKQLYIYSFLSSSKFFNISSLVFCGKKEMF